MMGAVAGILLLVAILFFNRDMLMAKGKEIDPFIKKVFFALIILVPIILVVLYERKHAVNYEGMPKNAKEISL